jgi:hypothetical protein
MSDDQKNDPTKDPEFQKVIRHFVTTPPQPHSEMKIGKRKTEANANLAVKKERQASKGHVRKGKSRT